MTETTINMTDTEKYLMLRAALCQLDNEITAFQQSQGSEPISGSQCASERASYMRPESLYTVSALGGMLVESVGEHVAVLTRAMSEPITPFACWTCVRSMLEPASIAAWLFDPNANAQQRVSRAFAHRYVGLEEQLKFGQAANLPDFELNKLKEYVDKLEQDATMLGFPFVRDRKGKRIGIGERMPSATEIIKLMLREEQAYRAFSAVAHAHSWALQQLGYSQAVLQLPQTADGARIVTMEKSAGSIFMHNYSVVRAAKAFALPVWYQCLYFGWDKDRLAKILESVYDQMNLNPATRFWR